MPGSEGPSFTRTLRVMALAFSVASLVFGALDAPSIIGQAAYYQPWWNVTAIVLTLGVPFVTGLFALRAATSSHTLQLLATVTAVGYLVTMLTLEYGLVDGSLPVESATPWLLNLTAVGTTSAAMAWQKSQVWIFVLVLSLLVIVDRATASTVPITGVALQDGLYTLMFTAIFAALALASLGTGRAVDRAAAVARTETLRAASAQARENERTRHAGLVHDSILSTLLTAMVDRPEFTEAAAQQARRVLSQFASPDQSDHTLDLVPVHEFIDRLRSAVAEVDVDATFELTQSTADSTTFAFAVVEAFVLASTEALANSVRHGMGMLERTTRAVYARVEDAHIAVLVIDSGPGFDRSRVPPARLGISLSIEGRMRSVPGGTAEVTSRVGRGTDVFLEWTR